MPLVLKAASLVTIVLLPKEQEPSATMEPEVLLLVPVPVPVMVVLIIGFAIKLIAPPATQVLLFLPPLSEGRQENREPLQGPGR